MEEQRVLTTAETALMLGLSERHIRRLIETGALTGEKDGRGFLLDLDSVLAFLAKKNAENVEIEDEDGLENTEPEETEPEEVDIEEEKIVEDDDDDVEESSILDEETDIDEDDTDLVVVRTPQQSVRMEEETENVFTDIVELSVDIKTALNTLSFATETLQHQLVQERSQNLKLQKQLLRKMINELQKPYTLQLEKKWLYVIGMFLVLGMLAWMYGSVIF